MKMLANRIAKPLRSGGVAALALALIASPGLAQELPMAPQQEGDSIEQMVAEFQETQQRLNQLQNQVIQANPDLQAHQEAIGEQVNQAMIEVNPAVETHLNRLSELEAEAMAAQQSQDSEALEALVAEAQGLQFELQVAHEEALEDEALQAEIMEFQESVMEGMLAIDPEAEQLLDRLEELSMILSAGEPQGF